MPPTIKTPAANASSNSLASPPIMAAPLSPASVKSRRELLRDHDTGFPEPLGGREYWFPALNHGIFHVTTY